MLLDTQAPFSHAGSHKTVITQVIFQASTHIITYKLICSSAIVILNFLFMIIINIYIQDKMKVGSS